MARILVVGAGDIGGQLAIKLAQANHDVWALRRSDIAIGEGVHTIQGDVSEPETLLDIPSDVDILVYTVASPEFSKEGYHKYYYRGICHVLHALKAQGQEPKYAFFTSSSSVYHQMDASWVDEDSPTEPNSFAGKELLQAEGALAKGYIPATSVRFPGIYGPGRTRMIEQARQGGHCDPTPEVWTNRIHRDDCVGVLQFLIEKVLAGEKIDDIYMACDSEPATLYDILEWMKDRIGDVEPDYELPEATRRANRRCSNKRLIAEGYQFQFNNYQEGYEFVLKELGL
ncbi:NAD(P)-dependent oxidoreductase [Oleispira antarctica]|uniref:NAD(P)-dependent oxidoreductase n=1 Tax=Oleispira antarctica TaxID=188908 RepID=A0A1Y5I0N6_OLEAN|nr:NAD(P)-dependent oxidoreductase [Oleispira antarctica]